MKARTLTDGVLLLIALAATTACSGISYNEDFDPEAAFSDYKTFNWITAENPEQVSKGVSPLVQRRIDRAVEEQLEAKGYEKAAQGDLFVNWYVGTEQKLDVTTYSHGWGYYGWYGGSTTSVRQWTEGTLVIDIIDAKTKELVWRGWAKGAVEPDATPERVTERINEIVAGILKRFPPDQG